MKRTLLFLSAAALAACGSSDNGDGADGTGSVSDAMGCTTISGGNTTVTVERAACPACVPSNEEMAIDGDTNTSGSLTSPSLTAGFVAFRAIAQDGVVFSAGSEAGAIAAISRNANIESGSIVLRTYLQDQLQEENAFSTGAANVNGVNNGQTQLYSFQTTEPFDSVAFGLSGSANNLDIEYFEFCSDK